MAEGDRRCAIAEELEAPDHASTPGRAEEAFKAFAESVMSAAGSSAEVEARRMLADHADDPGSVRLLAYVLCRSNRCGEALEVLARGLDKAPRSILLLNGLAWAQLTAKELQHAEETARRVLGRDSGNVEARVIWGRSLHARHQYREAVRVLTPWPATAGQRPGSLMPRRFLGGGRLGSPPPAGS